MPRIFLWLIFLLTYQSVFSQTQVNRSPPSSTVADARLKAIYNFYLPKGPDTSLYGGVDTVGSLFFKTTDNTLWMRVGSNNVNRWQKIANENGSTGSGGGSDSLFNGNRPITRDFSTIQGVNLGTTTTTQTLDKLLYPSQPPTATLSGGGTLELMASGTQLPFTLNWTAGRQAGTLGIQSIVVAGVNQTFSQPAPSASVSGTQGVLVSRNVNASFSNVVTTTDGKTATASIAYTFLPKRYWGFWSTPTPSDASVQALTNEFTTTRTKAQINPAITPSGSLYFVIAFPASLDPTNISTIWINGLDQTGTFTRTVKPFTNASGYTQSYIFFITTNPTAGAIQFEIR
jgi:hypothetical protein